jgi:hypothetical protein
LRPSSASSPTNTSIGARAAGLDDAETFKSARDPVESLKKALLAPAGSVMGGEECRKSGSTGARMLLLRAEGCSLCVALDVVEGVYEHPAGEGSRSASIDVVDWTDVSGFGPGGMPQARGSLVVIRTNAGPIGLQTDACLGVREVSFLETPPIPTRLLDEGGRPLCYLLRVDGQAHFLIEPHALTRARDGRRDTASRPVGIPALTAPRAAVGG